VERVRDEDLEVKGYGFGEFWRDVWGKGRGKRVGN
jgi:hypothetical protein